MEIVKTVGLWSLIQSYALLMILSRTAQIKLNDKIPKNLVGDLKVAI